jgi:ubiquinone biosynthesis protein
MANITIELGLGYVLLLPFWVAAIGWLSGRVLGIRIGRWRAAVAASGGWVAGLLAGAAVLPPGNRPPVLLIPVVIFFGVLATLPLAIVLDLVARRAPRRGRPRRTWRHPIRAARAVITPLGRFRELAANARRENLLHVRYRSAAALDSPDLARRLRLVLERSGGMFVKFGQIAATRTDLLPATITDELSHLHADVARVPEQQVRAVFEEELGEPVERAFGAFDERPLAAASMGQTHRATLHDGHPVVVKVQRPGMRELVRRDGSVLRAVARTLERRVEAARRVGARALADELLDNVAAELDYEREAAAGNQLRANRDGDVGVSVPAVHPTLTTGRVLVMDEIRGRAISDAAAVDEGPVERRELARRLLGSFLGQILQDGFYHADPHPGNIFIDPAGTLWLLDFGAVGRVDPVSLEGLQGIVLGFTMREGSVIARGVRHLVGDDRVDMRVLERDLSLLLGETEAGGISPAVLGGVLDVMERHGLEPPPSMLLLSRTLLTLEGTLKLIDPTFNLPAQATDLVVRDGLGDFGAPDDLVERELLRALPALRTLPEHVETLAGQLRTGRLSVRSERYAGADRGIVGAWIDRALVAGVAGIGALTAAVLLLAGSLSPDHSVRDALWVLGFSGLTTAAVLLMRTVAQSLHAQPVHSDRDGRSLGRS